MSLTKIPESQRENSPKYQFVLFLCGFASVGVLRDGSENSPHENTPNVFLAHFRNASGLSHFRSATHGYNKPKLVIAIMFALILLKLPAGDTYCARFTYTPHACYIMLNIKLTPRQTGVVT